MRERPVIAFENVVNSKRSAFILHENEAGGVGPGIGGGKSGANTARVPDVAEPVHGRFVGRNGAPGFRVADAGPRAAEGQQGGQCPGRARMGFDRLEIRARHFGGMVTQHGEHAA